MKKEKYLTNSPAQTRKKGQELAKKIIKIQKKKERVFVLGLEGDLGGGKTTFLQGFAKGLGIKRIITSPTFIVFKRYPLKNGLNFYHFDCYRIDSPKEILELGFKEIISNSKNIVAIEWADKIKKTLPQGAALIFFKFIDRNKRQIKIAP